ncbi:hypothetical protein POPTR_002G068100v4 [Populus trichocarpa]|uniref:Uncharacterized protein n=1 Tax=Populus trichocarpa TaxID=3694 RepID=U5GSA5_POPTR|nr:hypothetical protein BDE02_02G063100 [Populus trichocarpa]PNT48237.1 hypothetical protein POPTR_002G068100v4 [Populus trichocarpa]
MMASYACSLPRICQSVEVSGSMALNLKSVNVYRIKDVFFVVFWILCLRCWLRATWLSDQSGELISQY